MQRFAARGFSKKPEFVTFLLTDGSSLHFDKRLVVERSLHFANMLSCEAWLESRTNVVDLRNNEQADVKSMQAAPWLSDVATGAIREIGISLIIISSLRGP